MFDISSFRNYTDIYSKPNKSTTTTFQNVASYEARGRTEAVHMAVRSCFPINFSHLRQEDHASRSNFKTNSGIAPNYLVNILLKPSHF